MAKFEWKSEGFLKKAEYSSYFHGFFTGLENHLNVKTCVVTLREDVIIGNRQATPYSCVFGETGTTCLIDIPFQIYHMPNGKLSPAPTPSEVFEKIRHVIANAEIRHENEFPN